MTPTDWESFCTTFLRSSRLYRLLGARWIGPILQAWMARRLMARLKRLEGQP